MFGIETSKGHAFLQYTHETKSDGSLIRVLPGLYDGSPDLPKLVNSNTVFFAFVPIAAALAKSLIWYVGQYPVPEHAKPFPLFRQHELSAPGQRRSWSLWDGQRSSSISALSDDQTRLPIRSIVTPSLLATRLAEGWTPHDEPLSEPDPQNDERISTTRPTRHYIYFNDHAAASQAEAQLKVRRIAAEVLESQDPKHGWLVRVIDDLDGEGETAIQRVASEFGGKYDGYDRKL